MNDKTQPFQKTSDSNLSDDRSVVIKPVSGYKCEPIRWLEEGRIALGKLTMIAGDPGLGKSFITLDMAARVTRGELPMHASSLLPRASGGGGRVFADGGGLPIRQHEDPLRPSGTSPTSVGEAEETRRVRLTDPGQVVLLNAEDDAGDTIRPRLEAMGADITKIHMFEGIVQPMGKVCNLTQLDTDIQLLAHAMKKIDNLKLVVIDPISAYMGKTDSHNNADVRSVLAELSRLAAWTGAAVVCVTHLNKDTGGKRAIYRAMGSLAFTAAARAVHLVTKHPDDASKRIVAPVKNNLGIEMRPKVYQIDDGTVQWLDEEVEWDADGLENAKAMNPSALEEAKRFLVESLKHGDRPSRDVLDDATGLGLSEITLQRARRALGIRSIRYGRSWNWILDPLNSDEPCGAMRAAPEPDLISGLDDEPERDHENGFVPMREDR